MEGENGTIKNQRFFRKRIPMIIENKASKKEKKAGIKKRRDNPGPRNK